MEHHLSPVNLCSTFLEVLVGKRGTSLGKSYNCASTWHLRYSGLVYGTASEPIRIILRSYRACTSLYRIRFLDPQLTAVSGQLGVLRWDLENALAAINRESREPPTGIKIALYRNYPKTSAYPGRYPRPYTPPLSTTSE